MPEGHTIHRLARDLNRTLRSHPVRASSPQGLFADGAAELDGQELLRAEAWGKHLFIRFEDRPVLHIHLGLIGKLRPKGADAPIEGQIRLRLATDEETWDLTGPMTCALTDPTDVATVTNQLGPDPLRHRRGAERLGDALSRRSIPIAAALLDQSVIAGIGNVYRSEFCYLMGIHPDRPARSLSRDQHRELWDIAVDQLRLGVRLNRIVTRDPDEVGTTA
ncbi:MAG: Fpg/Nei family DNA glycosylase, partial [Acidimicrobiales bacterium]